VFIADLSRHYSRKANTQVTPEEIRPILTKRDGQSALWPRDRTCLFSLWRGLASSAACCSFFVRSPRRRPLAACS
jgi:hypothetical protein